MKAIAWKYKSAILTNRTNTQEKLVESLDRAGSSGWELVGIYRLESIEGELLIFKKPVDLIQ
jgi:hypothetical protein